jgi:hypothetical protein
VDSALRRGPSATAKRALGAGLSVAPEARRASRCHLGSELTAGPMRPPLRAATLRAAVPGRSLAQPRAAVRASARWGCPVRVGPAAVEGMTGPDPGVDRLSGPRQPSRSAAMRCGRPGITSPVTGIREQGRACPACAILRHPGVKVPWTADRCGGCDTPTSSAISLRCPPRPLHRLPACSAAAMADLRALRSWTTICSSCTRVIFL